LPAFLFMVGRTFLSAPFTVISRADKNVCPTEHLVTHWPCVVSNAAW
jgi:hypothetical protein